MRHRGAGAEAVPLRDYVDHIYAELQTEMDRRVVSVQATAIASDAAIEKRLDGMDALRAVLNDTAGRMTPRDTFDAHVATTGALFSAIEARLTSLESSARTTTSARQDYRSALGTRLVALGVAVSVVVVVVNIIFAVVYHKLRGG